MTDLHHESGCVERYHRQDEVVECIRHDDLPHCELYRRPVDRHVEINRPSVQDEVNAAHLRHKCRYEMFAN